MNIQTRFPMQPVLDRIAAEPQPSTTTVVHFFEHGRKQTTLSEKTGICRRSIVRWCREGVPYWSADVLATRLGVHPSMIWPDWYDVEPLVA